MTTTLIAAAEAAGETPSPLGVHLSELIFCLVIFAILFFLIRKFVVPNFEKAYAARAAAIEGGMDEATQAQAEAEALKTQYTAQLADARHDAARIREDAKEQGAQIVAEMRGQAQAEAERITSTAHTQIEAERTQAFQQLKGEVGSVATQLAGRIVGESLDDQALQRRTVERFIAELEESAN